MSTTATGQLTLYRCSVTVDFLLAASSWADARMQGSRYAGDALHDLISIDVDTEEVRSIEDVRTHGYADDEPIYGDEVEAEDVAEFFAEHEPVSEQNGPVYWCQRCGRNRVQFDFRETAQICKGCKEEAAAWVPPEAA